LLLKLADFAGIVFGPPYVMRCRKPLNTSPLETQLCKKFLPQIPFFGNLNLLTRNTHCSQGAAAMPQPTGSNGFSILVLD
jgi:hypothetical protein